MAARGPEICTTDETGDVYEDRKAILTERLQKREVDRVETVNKRKEEKESTESAAENVNLFHKNFSKLKGSIVERLAMTSSVAIPAVSDHLGKVAKEIDGMKKYITEATIYLPAYDMQKSQATLSELQSELQRSQMQFAPQKKFAFKARSKATAKEPTSDSVEKVAVPDKKKFNIEVNEIAIKDRLDETILYEGKDVNDKDIVLANLENCTVILQGAGSSMQIDRLTNCRIFCGPVSRSIFINSCTNCTFILACQQLRIHHTSNVTFYVHVTTRAIIEDTTNVKFGQYHQKYPEFEEHWEKAGLDKDKNNWNDIDDFNYLASDAKSPNWSLVSAEEQSAMEQSL